MDGTTALCGTGVGTGLLRRLSALTTLLILAGLIGGVCTARAASSYVRDVPKVTAQAVYAIDATAGVELYALNADQPRPPASTTKIASAIVFVDAVSDLNQPVTIEDEDVARLADDESRMGLEPGDVVTAHDLLEGMLIQSGADATYAAARIAGSAILARSGGDGDPIAAFVGAMNALAGDLHLAHTHFANPVGIDEDGQVSTARDLASLAVDALKRGPIAEVVALRSVKVRVAGADPREVTLENTNQLLDGDAIYGVKTGTTEAAGACLVLAKREPGGNQLITVVLGSHVEYDADNLIVANEDKRWADTEAVVGAVERDVRWLLPDDPTEVPGLRDELAAWQVELRDRSAVVVPADRLDAFRYVLQLGPAAKANTQVGRVLFFVGSEKIAEKPVFQAPTSAG
jgi:serine-type D-Ala-D-Ala carboxypeptidase (penicillin-binding protein 5/6)